MRRSPSPPGAKPAPPGSNGSIQPRRASRARVLGALAALAAAALIAGHHLTRPAPVPDLAAVKAAARPSEAWLTSRDGTLLEARRMDFQARRLGWVPLAAIAPALPAAVIASEDQRFARHGGVDWLAVAASIRARLAGQPPRGASTIAMQLAAFIDPALARPGARDWRAKLRQMRAAMALTARWRRDELIEAYLNLAPLRGELAGVGAGAELLFGKPPAALSPAEAALFAALLPSPNAGAAALAARACRIAGRAGQSAADCAAIAARATAVTSGQRLRAANPGLAPHLASQLLTAPGERVASSIDMAAQRIARAALIRQLGGLGAQRVRDGAVVVVDNASGDVLAYVGGGGPHSTAPAVDGASAYRQAGSTLKPHLFAQVIDRGWLTAASVLDDNPVQLDTASGLYVPRNYDNSFRGPVSVRTALAASLNVPAVRALVLGDVQQFRDRLRALGFAGLVEDGAYYGYSLALGSAEVTLLEQANAARTLANGGRMSPLRLRADQAPAGAGQAILSPAAAFIIGDILADPAARADAFGSDSALRLPFWAAAKTGTSKGMRDNWCIGWTSRFTVAVWVGNLEGDPMRGVSGTSGAAPVWRDVMLALHAGTPPPAPRPPAGVTAAAITLPGTREPPRREYFMAGTAQAELAAAPAAARRPRITSPVNGSVYALDPDIPPDRQRLLVRAAGAGPGYRLMQGTARLADGDAGIQLLPVPGSHLLTLVDPGGRVVDRVRYTVR